MAKRRTFKEFKQGLFNPIHKEKCINKELPVYRSGLEQKIMFILDKHPKVKKWGSETSIIPYFKRTENRYARYFIDFYVQMEINGKDAELLIEVKPEKEATINPFDQKAHKNKKQSTILYEKVTYLNNQDKWAAAKKWCEAQQKNNGRNIDFLIITEKDIQTLLGN